MQYIFKQSFIEALKGVLSEYGLNNIKIVEINESEQQSHPSEVIVYIGISGNIRGNLILKSNYESAHALISAMLQSMNMTSKEKEFGEFHRTAMGEIVNQISGRAITILSTSDIDCDISPPAILTGKRINALIPGSDSFVHINVIGSFGELFIALGQKNYIKHIKSC